MTKKKSAKPIVLAVFSDLHAGSTVAPCPPEGVDYPDGGTYVPSKVQQWLWRCWEDYWRQIAALRDAHGATLGILSNGDLVDGPGHHRTHQSVSPNTADAQAQILARLLDIPQALRPDWWVMVTGTGSHVGNGGDAEAGAARRVGAVRAPDGAWTWYGWRAELHGVRVDARHHGRTGGRPWTRASALGILATEIMVEHVEAGVLPPHVAIRSHKHEPGDTGSLSPVRVLATPAWQVMTEFAHKVVAEKAVNQRIGGYALVIQPNGTYEVRDFIYRPAPAPAWRPAA